MGGPERGPVEAQGRDSSARAGHGGTVPPSLTFLEVPLLGAPLVLVHTARVRRRSRRL